VFLSGTDAWYHLRAIEWSVENWPQTIPYDVYSAFPTGASHGEFGTIYDLVIATVAFIIGLGDQSQQTIALTLLYTPAVLGTLIIFPVYYLAAKIAGRGAGLVSAVLLAAMPGVFLERGLVGYASHNIAEVLLMVLAVTFIFLAIRSIPQQSHLTDFLYSSSGTFDGAVKYSVFAGAFTALYLMVWPAGIAFLGFFAAFIAFRILSDTASRTPLELISIPGVVIPFTTGAVLLPVIVGNTVLYSALSFPSPNYRSCTQSQLHSRLDFQSLQPCTLTCTHTGIRGRRHSSIYSRSSPPYFSDSVSSLHKQGSSSLTS